MIDSTGQSKELRPSSQAFRSDLSGCRTQAVRRYQAKSPWAAHILGAIAFIVSTVCGTALSSFGQSDLERERKVPRTLLKLLHTPEVQQILELDVDQQARFRRLLVEVDREWWPSRIQSDEVQAATVKRLEERAKDELRSLVDPDVFERVLQIELQSLGTRALLREDVISTIGLTVPQIEEIEGVFQVTDSYAAETLATRPNDSEAAKKLKTLRESELPKIRAVLNSSQVPKLNKLLGEPFPVQHLKRIYPLAPELIDTTYWASGRPTTLKENLGRVVLVHFYAFQCHNCVANFDHYKRWHEELTAKGVSVIGIQTPETKAESNPELVAKAAAENGFNFPVIVDVDKSNWKAWGNNVWPTVYVIDKQGYLRMWWQGELNWQGATGDKTIENLVQELLNEK